MEFNNRKLNTIDIKASDLGRKYPKIGTGSEGKIYKLNPYYAFKCFKGINEEVLEHKLHKIEYIGKYQDENFALPIGFVSLDNSIINGYYMDLVNQNKKYPNFRYLKKIKDINLGLDLLIMASEALARAHDNGFVLGDVKGENILITKDYKPIFIDTDNYIYNDMDFEVVPYVSIFLNNIYGRELSLIDSDKFLLANLAMHFLGPKRVVTFSNAKEYYNEMINLMNIDESTKEELRCIFSDSDFKPYIGPVLKRVKNRELYTKEDIKKLKKI